MVRRLVAARTSEGNPRLFLRPRRIDRRCEQRRGGERRDLKRGEQNEGDERNPCHSDQDDIPRANTMTDTDIPSLIAIGDERFERGYSGAPAGHRNVPLSKIERSDLMRRR